MSAISNRLERGLKAAQDGDVDTARRILGEVADEGDGWAPISGLSSQVASNYYALLGQVLEHEAQDEVAEEAFSKAHDLEEEAIELELRFDAYKNPVSELVPCACGSLADVKEEDHDWHAVTATWEDGANRVTAELNSDTVRHEYEEDGRRFETVETVETFESVVSLGDADDVHEEIVGLAGEASDGWVEKRVEAFQVVRTTYVYEGERDVEV